MPYCGYCGKFLITGEECNCPEAVQKRSGAYSAQHEHICPYCGSAVPAGKTCSCPQAEFESRYVRSSARNVYSPPQTPYYNTPAPYKRSSKLMLALILGVTTVCLISFIAVPFAVGFKKGVDKNSKSKGKNSTVVTEAVTDKSQESSESPVDTANSSFPKTYSLIDQGLVIDAVDNQGEIGSCSAFTWIGAVENRLLAEGKYQDMSEWAFYKSFKEHFFNANRTNDIAAMASLQTAIIPEKEAPYPYDGEEYEIDEDIEKRSEYLLSDVNLICRDTDGTIASKHNKIKQYLQEGYALLCSVYYDDGEMKYTDDYNGAWYVNEDLTKKARFVNHAVLIIGWDDSYSKDNFLTPPSSDGAWLIKNSWGPFMGDDGYYWLSYEDKMLNYDDIGAIEITPAGFCDKVQSYWNYGWDSNYFGSSSNTAIRGKPTDKIYQACKYTAETDMDITAVSFFTVCDGIDYEVYLTSKSSETIGDPHAYGTARSAGYHMIQTTSPFHVNKGEEYTVLVVMNSPKKDYLIVQDSKYSYDQKTVRSAKVGTCYVSNDGENWEDVKSYTLENKDRVAYVMPLCISAYGK